MMPEVALLVSRADTPAARMLLIALDSVMPRPRLHAAVDVDGHKIDITVALNGRHLAVVIGRTGEHRTEADKARDAALERAGWPVYRLPADRALTRPMLAVGDILAALMERGAPVPAVPRVGRGEAAPVPIAELRALCAELGRMP